MFAERSFFLNYCYANFFFFFRQIEIGRLNYYCRYGFYRRYESDVNKFRSLFSVLLSHVYVAISRTIYSVFSIWFCDIRV